MIPADAANLRTATIVSSLFLQLMGNGSHDAVVPRVFVDRDLPTLVAPKTHRVSYASLLDDLKALMRRYVDR
jgi:hypothetical protein